jgi:hypothetical protein
MIDPEKIIRRDQRMLISVIDRWNDKKDVAVSQISRMQTILEMAKKALGFIRELTTEKREELKNPLAWRNYEELIYVFSMNELF